jgi:hypothetical protein
VTWRQTVFVGTSERASNNTEVMNDDDNNGRREIMSFWFVVCSCCLLVCMRTLVSQQERGDRMGNDMGEGKCDKIIAHPSRLIPVEKK